MMIGRLRLGGLALVTGLILVGSGAGVARAATSWVLTQRSNDSTTRLILAPTELRFDFYAPVQSGGKIRARRPKPFITVIIRYRDGRLWVVNPAQRQYQAMALTTAITGYDNELKLMQKAGSSLPPAPGSKHPRTPVATKQPPARLRALRLTTRIGPVRARAYLLTQGMIRERIWYSSSLPSPPAKIAKLISQALAGTSTGPLGRVLRAHAEQLPLRIDERFGRRFRIVLSTVSIVRERVSARTLAAPRGYRKANLLATGGPPRVHTADVPADPIRCGALVFVFPSLACANILTSLQPLVGPVSSHPAIYAWYWGSGWQDHVDFINAINQGLENMVGDQFASPDSVDFYGPLSQYGVHQGKFLGYSIDNSNPPRSVGSDGILDVAGFVLGHRWGTNAPKFWWRGDGDSPIFAIFVDGSRLDPSGWSGYHAFVPTEAVFLFFLMHPAMPFFIIKTPELDTLNHDTESQPFQSAVDQTTEYASHELVEAATDPYPFTAWGDPLKEPIWYYGEIADICQEGNIAPYATDVRLHPYGAAFEPYWSNDANACVPDTQPDAQIVYPQNGATFPWDSPITFAVKSSDMFDNGPEPACYDSNDGTYSCGAISWQEVPNGPALPNEATFADSTLSPGTHEFYATVTDSQGGTRTVGPTTIHVVVRPPVVHIDGPADGSTFGNDQLIPLRGVAIDPEQGDLGPSATWSVDGTPVGTGANLLRYDITSIGQHTVTLSATNGGGATSTASIQVNVVQGTGKPSVAIIEPGTNASFAANTSITFQADANAVAGHTIKSISWNDDVDGHLGNGASISKVLSGSNCQIVTHHVTVTATDDQNKTATDEVTVNVGDIC